MTIDVDLIDGVEAWLVLHSEKARAVGPPTRYIRCPNCGKRVRKNCKPPHHETAYCHARRATLEARHAGLQRLDRKAWKPVLEDAGWRVWQYQSGLSESGSPKLDSSGQPTRYVECAHLRHKGEMGTLHWVLPCTLQTELEYWSTALPMSMLRMLAGTTTTFRQRSRVLEAVMIYPELLQSAKTCMRLAADGKYDTAFKAFLQDVGDRYK